MGKPHAPHIEGMECLEDLSTQKKTLVGKGDNKRRKDDRRPREGV